MFNVLVKVTLTLLLLFSCVVEVVELFEDFDSDLLNSIEQKETLKGKHQDPLTLFHKLEDAAQAENKNFIKSEKFNPSEAVEYYNSPYELFPEYQKKHVTNMNSIFEELNKDLKYSYLGPTEKIYVTKNDHENEAYLSHLREKILKTQNNNYQPFALNNYETPSKDNKVGTAGYGKNLNVSNTIEEGSKYLQHPEGQSNNFGYTFPIAAQKTDKQEKNSYGTADSADSYTSDKLTDSPANHGNSTTPNPNALFALLDEDFEKGNWHQQGLKDKDILYLQGHYPKLFDKVNSAIQAKKNKQQDLLLFPSMGKTNPVSKDLNKFNDLYKLQNPPPLVNNQLSNSSIFDTKNQQFPIEFKPKTSLETVTTTDTSNNNWIGSTEAPQHVGKFIDLFKDKSQQPPPFQSNQEPAEDSMEPSKSQQFALPNIKLGSAEPKGKGDLPLENNQETGFSVNQSKSLLPQESDAPVNPKIPQRFQLKTLSESSVPSSEKSEYLNNMKMNLNEMKSPQLDHSDNLELTNHNAKKPLIKLKVVFHDTEEKTEEKPNMKKMFQEINNFNAYEMLKPLPKPEAVLHVKTANNTLYVKRIKPNDQSIGSRRHLVPKSKQSKVHKFASISNGGNEATPGLLKLYNDLCTAQLRDTNYLQPGPISAKLRSDRKIKDFMPLDEDIGINRESLKHMIKVLRKYKTHVSTLLRDASDLEMGVMEAIISQLGASNELIDSQSSKKEKTSKYLGKEKSSRNRDEDKYSRFMDEENDFLSESADKKGRKNHHKFNSKRVGKNNQRNRKPILFENSMKVANRKNHDRKDSYLSEENIKKLSMQEYSNFDKDKDPFLKRFGDNSKLMKLHNEKFKGEDDDDDDDNDGLKGNLFGNNEGKVRKLPANDQMKSNANGHKNVDDEGKTYRHLQCWKDGISKINSFKKKEPNYGNENKDLAKFTSKYGAIQDPLKDKLFLRTKETFTEKPELPDKSDLEYYEDLKGDEMRNRGHEKDYYYEE